MTCEDLFEACRMQILLALLEAAPYHGEVVATHAPDVSYTWQRAVPEAALQFLRESFEAGDHL